MDERKLCELLERHELHDFRDDFQALRALQALWALRVLWALYDPGELYVLGEMWELYE